jgi:hypothetical protein
MIVFLGIALLHITSFWIIHDYFHPLSPLVVIIPVWHIVLQTVLDGQCTAVAGEAGVGYVWLLCTRTDPWHVHSIFDGIRRTPGKCCAAWFSSTAVTLVPGFLLDPHIVDYDGVPSCNTQQEGAH